MPVLSKPIKLPETFTLEERKHMALTWIDREQREGKIPNRKMISEACNIAYSTMMHAANGRRSVEASLQARCKLTSGEETAIVERISLLTSWLQPPKHALVEDMALGLLLLRDDNGLLGQQWIYSFINRNQQLSLAFSKQLEHCRALQVNNPVCLNLYFDRLTEIVTRYDIQPKNTYNFDEIGFMMETARSEKVVIDVRELRHNGALRSYDGNREMATVIEGACADGTSLSPMIIYKAEGYKVGWFDPRMPFPDDVLCGYSPNGWTDTEMGLGYLQHHFGPTSFTATKADGQYRLIIFDGHSSDVSHAFIQYCIENRIIAFCLPPHSTNILQPMDVGVFGPYKDYYAQILEREFRYGRFGVSKTNFWEFLSEARHKAFTPENIKSAFATTGIYPLCRYTALRKVPAYDPIKHPDPATMYDDISLPIPSIKSRKSPKTQDPTSPFYLLSTLQAPSTRIPTTPKTSRSLKALGEDLIKSSMCPSLSPSKIRIQSQKISKLLHSAQYAFAKNHLTEEARLGQKKEERKRKARTQAYGRKKIPNHGQAFATAEDLRRWRRDIVTGERKQIKSKLWMQMNRKKAIQDQIQEAERKLIDKRNNPRSRMRMSIEKLEEKLQETRSKLPAIEVKIAELEEKLDEFVREGLDCSDNSDGDSNHSAESEDDLESEEDGTIVSGSLR